MPSATKAIARTFSHEDAAYRLAGMLIVSLFPALFWTLAVSGIGAAMGHVPDLVALIMVGTSVAVFCAMIFQALSARR